MDFIALAQECAPWVAHQTMAAIIKTESGFKPFAIGVNGGAKLTRQPQTKQEAIITATWLITNGYNIDLGLGQVNSANLPKTGLSVEDAFDPCKNISIAANILHSNFKVAKTKVQGDQAALRAALSAYNTGSYSRGFDNGYVRRVVSNANTVPPIELTYTDMPITDTRIFVKPVNPKAINPITTIKINATKPNLKELKPIQSDSVESVEILDVFSRSETLIKDH